MHSVIANAAMHRKILRSSPQDNVLALSHNIAAINSINQRIGNSNQNATDEMMGAILGVLIHGF